MGSMKRTGFLLFGLFVAGALGPDFAWSGAPIFDSAEVHLVTGTGTVVLQVEVADTDPQRRYGLMERASLGAQRGMLFRFPKGRGPNDGFWMFRTRIPLDIAFIDSAGVIRAILGMKPCRSQEAGACPVYRPGVAYQMALEVNQGFFRAHGVTVGSKLVMP